MPVRSRAARCFAAVTLQPMSASPVDLAYAHLRSNLSGLLRFDDHTEPLKVIVAPDGRLVAPVMVAMLTSFDTVLHLPDEGEESLQLMVTLEELDERGPDGALADRWQAYHGSPPDVRWAYLSIDAAKQFGHFIDGSGLSLPNDLAEEDAKLCRELNGDPATLRRACDAALPKRIEAPVVVGVDSRGLDIRGAFSVHRLAAPHPLPDAAAVRAFVRSLAHAT